MGFERVRAHRVAGDELPTLTPPVDPADRQPGSTSRRNFPV
jgi:hypothetical protein